MVKPTLVSIIFANYNGGQEPIDCLESIQSLKYPHSQLEVAVIDNGSSDGSPDQIAKKFPWVKLIKQKRNLGFAKAINLGIKQSSGEYLFIANDDLVFEEDSLTCMVDYLSSHSKVGVIGGKIFLKSKSKKIISSGFNINRWTGDIGRNLLTEREVEPDFVQGCAMLIPRLVLNKIGPLDDSFVHLFEDVDFCFRTRRAGLKVVYLPTAHFWHGESLTADKNKAKKYFHWYQGKFRFILKHFSPINVASILFIQILLVMPYRTIFLGDGRFQPFIKGLIWNLVNLRKTMKARYEF